MIIFLCRHFTFKKKQAKKFEVRAFQKQVSGSIFRFWWLVQKEKEIKFVTILVVYSCLCGRFISRHKSKRTEKSFLYFSKLQSWCFLHDAYVYQAYSNTINIIIPVYRVYYIYYNGIMIVNIFRVFYDETLDTFSFETVRWPFVWK